MDELNDQQLLKSYTDGKSEAAFATLVARHLRLVYSTALRFTGETHGAEGISQAVFIILTRKTAAIPANAVLPGWLQLTAWLTAANYIRSESRHRQRKQAAVMQSAINEPVAADS